MRNDQSLTVFARGLWRCQGTWRGSFTNGDKGMHSSHSRGKNVRRDHRRSGLLAASEMMCVITALLGLSWAASQAVTFPDSDGEEHSRVARACSERPVYRLALTEPEHRLWVFRFPGEVNGLNLATGKADKSRSSQVGHLSSVAHSRDGTTSLMVTQDKFVQLDRQGHDSVWLQLSPENRSVIGAAISAIGNVSLVGLTDSNVYGWSVIDGRVEAFQYQLSQQRRLIQMCLDGDGGRLFAAYNDGSASIHDSLTGELILGLSCPNLECTAATWSEDGRNVVVATSDRSIQMIDAGTGLRVWQANSHLTLKELARVTCLAISSDGRWIAAGGLSTCCAVWDRTTSDSVYRLSGHDGLVRAVTFAPSTKSLFTGSLDGTVREWSLESFTTLRTFE